jgi:hypothetical protein
MSYRFRLILPYFADRKVCEKASEVSRFVPSSSMDGKCTLSYVCFASKSGHYRSKRNVAKGQKRLQHLTRYSSGKSLLFSAAKTTRGADPSRSSYAQGGIVARLDVKSEVLIWPSGLPSSSTSTLDQAPDWTRILTLAFRGTRLSDLQF